MHISPINQTNYNVTSKKNNTNFKGLLKIGGLMSNQAKVFVDYYQKNSIGKNSAARDLRNLIRKEVEEKVTKA